MSNSISSPAQQSNELDFSNLLGDVGGDFDIFMASQQLDIPAPAQSSSANGLSTSDWEWGSPQTQVPQPWHLFQEHPLLTQTLCQAPDLDQPQEVNCNVEGTSSSIAQSPFNMCSHTPFGEPLPEQQPTTRFCSNPPENQIAYFGGEYDSEYDFGAACGCESEDLFAHESFEETLFWQPTVFNLHLSVESPTPQQREFVESNSFQGIDYVQMNDDSANLFVKNPSTNTAQQTQQTSIASRSEWPDLTRECCFLFPSRAKTRRDFEYEQENGADWISPITLDRVKKVDSLSRMLDYQAIKKNASLLVVSEISGVELVSDIIPRLDPKTIPNQSKTVLEQAENAIGAEATKFRAKLVRKLRNDLSNLKRNFRRRLGMGMSLDFRPRKPGKARGVIKSTDAADKTLSRRVPLTAENFFHNTPYQVCHSTKTFRAPLRLNGNGDIEWTDYPLEPARPLSEKARTVLQNVGIDEPDFDQYVLHHIEYRTWSPDKDHSEWKPEYRMLGPPSGIVSPLASVHNRETPGAGKQTELQSPQPTGRKRQCQGIAPEQPVMNSSAMQLPLYVSHSDRNLKRSVSEAGFHNSDIIVDRKIEDRPEKKMRVRALSD